MLLNYFVSVVLLLIFAPCTYQLSTNSVRNDNKCMQGRRDFMTTFQDWSIENGVTYNENIFNSWEKSTNEPDNDWGMVLQKDTAKDTVLVTIPSKLVLSSQKIQSEFSKDPSLFFPAIQLLKSAGFSNQIPQFYLYIKLLIEYEKNSTSFWYQWIQSLPRNFDTAICMNEMEMDCLPPIAYTIAKTWRLQYNAFNDAIQVIPQNDIISESMKSNKNVLEWAYNVVFTRCWCYTGEEDSTIGINKNNRRKDVRVDLVPLGDMFNHGEDENIRIDYDSDDNVIISLRSDMNRGNPLLLSYGKETNPYHFLTIFGFVDEYQSEIFCQLFPNHDDSSMMRFDTSKMVFRTKDGAISNAVWDFILYTILKAQVPDDLTIFNEAHVNDNKEMKAFLHSKYHLESCICLKNHVDQTIRDMNDLRMKMDRLDDEQNSRIIMIRKNNKQVTRTFQKVKSRLDNMIQENLALRRRTRCP